MPIYVYQEILPDGSEGETIEVLQSLSAPPLTTHPEKGTPIRRILASVSIAGRFSDSSLSKNLSDKKLGEKGFTKYVKTDDGRYEKTAGKGPKSISAKKK